RWFTGNCARISEDTAESATLVVSELVTNAILASMKLDESVFVELSLRLFDNRLLIEVSDSSPELPVPGNPEDFESEGGRGLLSVSAVSAQWGYFLYGERKVVFAVLSVIPEH
ncbi:MAG TPA: ATP-binding protein, partial [Trebonia sp.]|nr:ATP-binding protein [Trebonia sp.]